jgi:CheY-like chemotaxis protein
MGGTLGVESVVGEGTTFWLELPAAESPLEREDLPCGLELAVAEPGATRGQRLVVYIEDNLPNLLLIRRIFSRRPGIHVVTATDGRLGLGVVRDQRPDLVLLDLNLPDISGQEVLARLRADPRTSDVPVIVLSADASPGQIARLLAGGAHGYVTKPLEVRKLLAAVDAALALVPPPPPVRPAEVFELC